MEVRTIKGIYKFFRCGKCKKDIILITEEVESTIKAGKYISCSHCGSKYLKDGAVIDDLRKVMNERSYKRHNGAIVQKGGGAL
jgi:DNA-directed RNA polymerase subunit RPC12/RpoP